MISYIRPALVLSFAFMIITGLAYPLFITGLGQTLFPSAANGSLVRQNGAVVGSRLIGQANASDKYFWPRPSAAGNGYDAAASSGSNLGPTSRKLLDRIAGDAARIKETNGVSMVPADAVTASASGLDPDISPEFAQLQAARIAKARGLTEEQILNLIRAEMQAMPPRVNVLLLNLALDSLKEGNG